MSFIISITAELVQVVQRYCLQANSVALKNTVENESSRQ